MIRQVYINGVASRLYEALKEYEGVLFDEVGYAQYGTIENISMSVGTGVNTQIISNISFSVEDGFSISCSWEGEEGEPLGPDPGLEEIGAAAASTGATLVNKLDFSYGTDNGIMLHFTYDSIDGVPNLFTTIIIAKGSDGYPFFIIANPGTAPSANDLTHKVAHIYHYPDTDMLEFVMCQFDALMQTLAVPFAGVGNASVVSKAPNAAWFPISAAYGVGFNRMVFGTTECVTNGYWMLDDKQEEV